MNKGLRLILGAVVLTAVAVGLVLSTESSLFSTSNQYTAPLQRGFYKGKDVFYFSVETSDKAMAERLGLVYAPALANVAKEYTAALYRFVNGVPDQVNIIDSIPPDPKYSPLWRIMLVTWTESGKPTLLTSVEQVLEAQSKGDVTVSDSGVVANCPVVKWQTDNPYSLLP